MSTEQATVPLSEAAKQIQAAFERGREIERQEPLIAMRVSDIEQLRRRLSESLDTITRLQQRIHELEGK